MNANTLKTISSIQDDDKLIVATGKKGTPVKVKYKDLKDSILASVPAGGDTATTTVVDISSAQILAMGSSPVELLPASGEGNYYDIHKIILEYTHVSTAYSSADDLYIYQGANLYGANKQLITNEQSGFVILDAKNITPDTVNGLNIHEADQLNSAVSLGTWNGANPTLGDGTLRAIITYTLRTFGA